MSLPDPRHWLPGSRRGRIIVAASAAILLLGGVLVAVDRAGDDGGQVAAGDDGGPTDPTSRRTTTAADDPTSSTGAGPTPTSGGPPDAAGAAAPTTGASAPTAPPATGPSPGGLEQVRITLTPVATLERPVELTTRPGDQALYVAEKGGRIRVLRDGQTSTLFDLSDEVSDGNEQGLLGLAWSPDGRRLYVHFTDRNGDTRLDELDYGGSGTTTPARRTILTVDQPYANHNGGATRFGPDGMLYVFLGDGGSGGDPHGNGQRLDTLLGKALRIDPTGSTDGLPYAIPADNPFAAQPGRRGEIWAYGLRNPWRASFDRASGDLWIGDVGQSAIEEIDLARAATGRGRGTNFGWNRMEGTRPYEGASPPPAHHGPIHEYANAGGTCAVTGGVVYRGDRIPSLRGVHLFGDFCDGDIQGLVADGDRAHDVRDLGPSVEQLSSFGEGPDGEVYVLSLAGRIARIDQA